MRDQRLAGNGGRWGDKFLRADRKWQSWQMRDYSGDARVFPIVTEEKARLFPNRIALHFGEANEIDRRQARRLRGLTECTLSGYPATNHVIARWLSGRDLLMPAIVRGSHLGAAEPG